MSRANGRDSNVRVSQGSRVSLRGPERWPGPLCVYCKIVVESRSRLGGKTETQGKLMKINHNMAKFGERNQYYRLKY